MMSLERPLNIFLGVSGEIRLNSFSDLKKEKIHGINLETYQ